MKCVSAGRSQWSFLCAYSLSCKWKKYSFLWPLKALFFNGIVLPYLVSLCNIMSCFLATAQTHIGSSEKVLNVLRGSRKGNFNVRASHRHTQTSSPCSAPAAPLDLLTDYEKLQSITPEPVLPLWMTNLTKSPRGSCAPDKHKHISLALAADLLCSCF